jgi:hypothetical protein
MSTPIQLTPGTLASTCFSSIQELNNAIVNGISAQALNTLAYVLSDTTPSADDRDKLWLKTVSGAPERWYVYYNGLWVSPHQIPASDNRLILYKGTSASVATLDGGNSNAVDAADGPFWEIDTDLSAKFPVGVGTFESGASVAVTGTGGSEKHTLTTSELPAHTHDLSINGLNAQLDSTTGNEYGADGNQEESLTTESTGGGEAHNNLPPYFGVYFLKRTARIYYTG